MEYVIENLSEQILVTENSNRDVRLLSKDGATVSAQGGVITLVSGDDVISMPFEEIVTPVETSVRDMIVTINDYINSSFGRTLYGNVVLIEKLSDFPAPISNVIQLADDTVYEISGAVDIDSNRLVTGNNTTIRGNSPALDYVYSSTTGALISSNDNFRLVEVGFKADSGQIFDLQGSGSEICLMIGVRFFGTGGLGAIADYDFIKSNIALFAGFSSGLVITGTNGQLVMMDTEFFQTAGTPTSLDISGGTFGHIRLMGCAFTTVAGGTGLAVAASSGNFGAGDAGIISGCNFEGAGTNISGWDPLDDQWNVSAENENLAGSDRYEPTGWGYYADSETAPATQALTTTYQKLQIDAGTTINSYLPQTLRLSGGELWDNVNDLITPVTEGDSYTVRLDLEITATGGGAGALYVQFDIGGAATPTNVVVDRVVTFGKAAPFTLNFTTSLYSLSTFLANGGQIFIATDAGTATLASRGILITRTASGAI